MRARLVFTAAAIAAIAGTVSAQTLQRRANIVGGGGDRGKCTIEVVVDGTAEVEIRGDGAVLRTLQGQPAQWRRFECSGVMPQNPADFRFAGVDGRGRQDLVRDPRNGGAAVVRIEDRDGGAEGYTFDIFWDSRGGGFQGGGRPDDRGVVGRPDDRGYAPRVGGDRDRVVNRRFTAEQAVQVCQESVRQQAADRFRTPNVVFRRTNIDDEPGRNDWVIGTLSVRRGFGREEHYGFSCSVNFDTGRVRSATVDATPRRGYRP